MPSSTANEREAMSAHFGSRMRYWRRLRGQTQAELAVALRVDGSYVSKLESSRRQPNLDIAQRCDEVLETGGELSGLLFLLDRDPNASSTPATVPMVLQAPTAPSPRSMTGSAGVTGPHTTATLTRLLESYVEVEFTIGGQQIATAVEQQVHDLLGLRIGASPGVSNALLGLAARYARLAGQIRYDACDDNGALFWYDCGRHWALAAADQRTAAELGASCSILYSRAGDYSGALALAATVAHLADDSATQAWAAIAQARGLAGTGDIAETEERLSIMSQRLSRSAPSLAAPPSRLHNDHIRQTVTAECHTALAATSPAHAPHAVQLAREALEATPRHHVRDLIDARLRLAQALRLAQEHAAASQQLTEVDTLIPRCTSARSRQRAHEIRDALGAASRTAA